MAIGIALAPVFLNKTALELVTQNDTTMVGTMSVWHIHPDGTRELVSAKEIPIVDEGKNIMAVPRQQRFKMYEEVQIHEAGLYGPGSVQRMEFEHPITLHSDDYLEVEYDYRLS